MTIYEFVQFYMKPRTYFTKLSNWLDFLIIMFSFIILLTNSSAETCCTLMVYQKICSITILAIAVQCVHLAAKAGMI